MAPRVLLPKTVLFASALLMVTISAMTIPPADAQTLLSTETSAPAFTEAVVSPGTPLAVSTTVVNGQGVPVKAGTVTFCIEGTENRTLLRHPCGAFPLATAQVTKQGVAASTIRLPVGAYKVVAVYAGTRTITGSVSPSTVATVSGVYPTTTSLSYTGTANDLSLMASVTAQSNFIPGYLSVRDLTSKQPLFSFPGPVTTGYSFYKVGANVPLMDVVQLNTTTVDLNNDGYPDVVSLEGPVDFYFNERGKTLTRAKAGPVPSTSEGFFAMGVADFNADGVPDLILFDESGSTFDIFLGNGNGSFPSKPSIQLSLDTLLPGQNVQPIGAILYTADFNEDGTIDFAFDDEGQFVVVPNNGDGTFGKPIVSPDGSTLADVEEGALIVTSSDGHTDVALPGDSNKLFFLKGHGDGTFTAKAYPFTVPYDLSLAIVNFDGNGYDDVFFGSLASYSADSPAQVGFTSKVAGDGKGGLTIGAGPKLPNSATNLLGLPYGVLATDNLGHYSLLRPDLSITNFEIAQSALYPVPYQYQPLVAAGDFNASGIPGFLLDTGQSGGGGGYNGMQTYSASAISTMTIEQTGFSFANADVLLGLYHPGGNAAFVSSDSPNVTAP